MSKEQPSPSVKNPGNRLLLLGIALQTLLWLGYYAPFLPLPPISLLYSNPLIIAPLQAPTSAFIHAIPLLIGVVGLFFYARRQGCHPAWSALGVVPLMGPLVGLVALTLRSKPVGLSLDPSRTVSGTKFWSVTLWFLAGWWIVTMGLWTMLLAGRPTITSISPDSSFRVHANDYGIHVQRVVGRIFLIELAVEDWYLLYLNRIVWSEDGSRFFIIGSESNCLSTFRLPGFNGAYPLVMYDSADGEFRRFCAYAESPDKLKQYKWHNFSF